MISRLARFKSRLVCRHLLTSLLLLLLIGGGFYLLLLKPLARFIDTVIENSMLAAAEGVQQICEINYGNLLRAGGNIDGPELMIQKAITLGLLEDYLLANNLRGQVFAGEAPLLNLVPSLGQTPELVVAPLDFSLLAELPEGGAVALLKLTEAEYYAVATTFSPWGWQILLLKESGLYQSALRRLHQASYVTIAMLLLWALLSVLFFKRQVENPIQEIISSLRRGEKPAYRGVAEFEFLSDRLRETMAEQEIMRRRFFEQQKLETIGILAGGIAHDFNNLLAAVYGQISLAALSLPPGHPSLSALQLAEKSSDRARSLTAQLLTFATGGPLDRRVQPISDLIEEIGRFVISGPDHRLCLEIPVDLWAADIDREQMGNVLHNLLLNAKEAMPAGGTLTISCANQEIPAASGLPLTAGKYLRIKVRDSGEGMAPEVAVRIFDPYFSTKERGVNKGTGLGLSICRSVIAKHGGHIEVESRPGHGTTFTIYLPASPRD